MKFYQLTMVNFMRYKGKNVIYFSCDPEKNVTVVLGDNTSGKTTIAQAFRYALYGEVEVEPGKKREDYLLLNREIADSLQVNNRGTVSVELRILQEIVEGEYAQAEEESLAVETHTSHVDEFILTRQRFYSRRGSGTNNFIATDSVSLRRKRQGDSDAAAVDIAQDKIEDSIREMLPRELSPFFLFDGEKWNESYTKRGSQLNQLQQSIKDSIHILTGLSGTKQALFHLKGMGTNSLIKSWGKKIRTHGAIAESILADIEREQRQIAQIKEGKISCCAEIEHYERMIEEREEYLLQNKNTQEIQKELRTIQARLKQAQASLDARYKDLADKISKNGYQYFAQPMTKRCHELMEKNNVERKDIPYIRQSTIDYLLEQEYCLCGCNLAENESARKALIELRQFLPPADMGSLLGEMERTARRWRNGQEDFESRIHEMGKEIAALREEILELSEEKKKKEQLASGNEEFQRVRAEKQELQQKKSAEERKIGTADAAIKQLQDNIAIQEKSLESMRLQSEENLRWQNRIHIAEQLYQYLEESFQRKEGEVFRRLNELIRKNFSEMFQASDKFLELDRNYQMHLYYKHMQANREETNLSEGEKVARNFAFIVSIMEYNRECRQNDYNESAEYLPIILDGPFSKLGAENIGLISARLPLISEQVILFMLDKDWKHVKMDAYVAKEYRYRIEKSAESLSATIVSEN